MHNEYYYNTISSNIISIIYSTVKVTVNIITTSHIRLGYAANEFCLSQYPTYT